MEQNDNLVSAAPDPAVDTPCWARIGIDGDGTCPELASVIHCSNCPVFSEAARGLLDRPLVEDYQGDWTARLAVEAENQKRFTHSVLIFSLQSEYLALPTAIFSEVTDVRGVHRI